MATILLRRLTPLREKQVREEQAGFRPTRGCIDQIFTIRRILEHRQAFNRPTIIVFLDIRGAFDSVDRATLWDCLSRKGVPRKFINLLRALYSQTLGRVRAYGELSAQFSIASGVRQGCPASPFLFNFAIDDVLELALQDYDEGGVELLPGNRIRDLEYADDIALLCDEPQSAQTILDRLVVSASRFGMTFAPNKCKVLLQDWTGLIPDLTLGGIQLDVVDKFVYLGSCISPSGLSDEISLRISKSRAAFAELRHLWRRRDINLSLKGRVYHATVRAVLLYGCETWPTRTEDLRRLAVFDHRCLRSIAGVWWEQHICNDAVRQRVFGDSRFCEPLDFTISRQQLRWIGHVLRMPVWRLPRRALFSKPKDSWKKRPGGQRTMWVTIMKKLTIGLAKVGRIQLPGWKVNDQGLLWLDTLSDMATNRSQWRSCCENLCSPPPC